VKKYPLCLHRAIDGVLDMLADKRVAPPTSRPSPSRPPPRKSAAQRPAAGLEAKFNIQFAMASTIAARRVGLT
jgi:hypothetical protein